MSRSRQWEEDGVHDRQAVEHCSHENVMPRAVDERYVTDTVFTTRPLARWVVLLVRAIRAVVPWHWASLVFAFVTSGDSDTGVKSVWSTFGQSQAHRLRPSLILRDSSSIFVAMHVNGGVERNMTL